MAGCGGFCGTLDSDRVGFTNAMNYGLRRNYAVSTMDAGHWGLSVLDGRWAYNNRIAEIDWGSRAVTETAKVTKVDHPRLLRRTAKEVLFRRLLDGRSNGCAGSPTLSLTILTGSSAARRRSITPALLRRTLPGWCRPTRAPTARIVLTKAKVPLIRDAVAKQCGDATGLVIDPAACTFKPASLICKAGQNSECLSAAEAEVLEKWYAGPKNSRGEQLFPGRSAEGLGTLLAHVVDGA